MGGIRADQSISFQSMQKKFVQFVNIIRADPAVAAVGGCRRRRRRPGRRRHQYRQFFVTLKPNPGSAASPPTT